MFLANITTKDNIWYNEFTFVQIWIPFFVVQSNNQLEDSKINTVVMPYSSSFVFRTQVESKEREHMFLVSTNFLQDSIGKDRVYFNQADYMFVGQDML